MKRIFIVLFAIFFFSLFYWGCNNPREEENTTPPQPVIGARGPQNFLHLKIDSAILVDRFYNAHGQFKKIMFDFIVKDFRVFPDSLFMGAYGVQGGQNDYMFCDPIVLDTVRSGTTVRTEQVTDSVMFATQEMSRQGLSQIVGNDGLGYDPPGPGAREPYDYLLFIPTRLDTCGKVYLRYKVRAVKRSMVAAAGSEGYTNPCPPNKPE